MARRYRNNLIAASIFAFLGLFALMNGEMLATVICWTFVFFHSSRADFVQRQGEREQATYVRRREDKR